VQQSLKRKTKLLHQGSGQAHTASRTCIISTGIKDKLSSRRQSHQFISQNMIIDELYQMTPDESFWLLLSSKPK